MKMNKKLQLVIREVLNVSAWKELAWNFCISPSEGNQNKYKVRNYIKSSSKVLGIPLKERWKFLLLERQNTAEQEADGKLFI